MQGCYYNVISYIAGPPPMVDVSLRTLIVEGHLTPDRSATTSLDEDGH